MKPGIYNIEARRNAEFSLTLNWQDEASVPMVLTGYTARMVVGYADNSDTVLLDFSTSNGLIVLGGNPHNIVVTIDVQGLEIGAYAYDLQLTSASGQDYPLLTGRFIVVQNKAG